MNSSSRTFQAPVADVECSQLYFQAFFIAAMRSDLPHTEDEYLMSLLRSSVQSEKQSSYLVGLISKLMAKKCDCGFSSVYLIITFNWHKNSQSNTILNPVLAMSLSLWLRLDPFCAKTPSKRREGPKNIEHWPRKGAFFARSIRTSSLRANLELWIHRQRTPAQHFWSNCADVERHNILYTNRMMKSATCMPLFEWIVIGVLLYQPVDGPTPYLGRIHRTAALSLRPEQANDLFLYRKLDKG